jgi:RNase H-fold protein (predicted Holliday junction resolvase)
MARINQRRLAFDVGTVRIGVATTDFDAILASPQTAIGGGEHSITSALTLIHEY